MLFLGYNGIKIKIVTIFVPTKNVAGCSSARLEYTSGGRVVASSNLVIPTMQMERVLNRKIGDFFYSPDP